MRMREKYIHNTQRKDKAEAHGVRKHLAQFASLLADQPIFFVNAPCVFHVGLKFAEACSNIIFMRHRIFNTSRFHAKHDMLEKG